MTSDELLDAHMQRLRTDPGYVAIWRRAHEQPNMQEIVLALAWAEQADGLRAMARAASSPSSELIALLDRGLKYGIVGFDCYSATNCVETDEIRKLIVEAQP